ncbi:MAG: cation-translocating P-type ATPase, partial [Eubacteriales bacterium]
YPTSTVKKALGCPSALFRGSVITSGQGIMRVLDVGSATLYGSLADQLKEETRESPLKLRLRTLAKTISRIGYFAAVLVAIGYFFNVIFVDSGFNFAIISAKLTNLSYMLRCLLHCMTLAVTIIVVAVPEGLPMMITVVLSANMKRMLKDRILVRKLVGIETAGSMDILFTDKTGTLTTGNQTVSLFLTGGGTEYKRFRDLGALQPAVGEQAIYNSDCYISGGKVLGGNATDRALGAFAREGRTESNEIIGKIPFDSKRKYSAVRLSKGSRRVLIKGAPDLLIPRSVGYLREDGSVQYGPVPYDVTRRLHEFSRQAYRLIALAYCDQMPTENRFGDLILIGFAVIRDEIRKDAESSVEQLRRAGIQVVMLTGDHVETAEAIARRCRIITGMDRSLVLTSEELAAMSDDQVADILPHLAVLARALPEDKSRLVRIAQSRERVVGMTGDGINDAPALKIADVGFAMGSGTEIAREAGDIVLMDNNLAYIVRTVLYGRTIFKSIRKFIMFQLTMNFCAVAVSLFGPFIGIDTPVTVIQMLWINIIMDTLGGLAFAGEPPVKSSMEEAPKKRDEPLVNRYMAKQIAFAATFSVSVCILFLKLPIIREFFGFDQNKTPFLTAFFGLFIFLGVVNCFIARTPRINLFAHIRGNKGFCVIMAAVTVVQLLMIYFGGTVFRSVPLPLTKLLFVFALSLLIVPFELIRRLILRFRSGNGIGL